jgi:hypothetical protein
MGYTHYWNHNGISTTDWRILAEYAHSLIGMASEKGINLAVKFDEPEKLPEINEAWIRFNGIGEDGHETFYLTREPTEFDFCKTARKPYDWVVADLLAFASHTIAGFNASHD